MLEILKSAPVLPGAIMAIFGVSALDFLHKPLRNRSRYTEYPVLPATYRGWQLYGRALRCWRSPEFFGSARRIQALLPRPIGRNRLAREGRIGLASMVTILSGGREPHVDPAES